MKLRRNIDAATRANAILTDLSLAHSRGQQELDSKIKALVALIHALDPIPRRTVWPVETVEMIARRQDFKCLYCGGSLPPLRERQHHVDHLIPWSLGGGNELSNVQVLHVSCNLQKRANYDYDDLLDYLEDRLRNI